MDDAKAAKEAFERAQYRDAEKLYERMLTKAPNNVYILSNLGVVYFRNQKWKLAEESLQKAIAVGPRGHILPLHPRHRLLPGEALRRRHQFAHKGTGD